MSFWLEWMTDEVKECVEQCTSRTEQEKIELPKYNALITLSYSRNLFNGVFLLSANVTVPQ